MPTLAATLRSEIRRLAARELKRILRPLRRVQKHVKTLRQMSRGQKRSLASVERRIERIKARTAFRVAGRTGRGSGPRLSPESIRTLRDRLRMTRLEFAKLVGVSPGSIFGWETGRTLPRDRSLSRVIDLRKMGVRKARQVASSGGGRRRPGRRRRARSRR
jgi:hypothetical protein